VALGRFGALIGRGLTEILHEDRNILVAKRDLDADALERMAVRRAVRVAVLDDEGVVAEPSVLTRLKTADPAMGMVVLVSGSIRAHSAQRFAPAVVVVSKNASTADILAAIHLAAKTGRRSKRPVDRKVERDHLAGMKSLTPRETEVLEHLMMGKSFAEIANALHISGETARTHAARIRRKLRLPSRWELLALLELFGVSILGQSETETP